MLGELEQSNLVGRPHNYEVSFRLTLDTADMMHYRVFAVFRDEGEDLKIRLWELLGAYNVSELRTERVEQYHYGVHLRLVSEKIEHTVKIFDVSGMAIKEKLRELLPAEHVVCIEVLNVKNLDAYGWTR